MGILLITRFKCTELQLMNAIDFAFLAVRLLLYYWLRDNTMIGGSPRKPSLTVLANNSYTLQPIDA